MLSALAFAVTLGSQSLQRQQAGRPIGEVVGLLEKAGYPIRMEARIEPSGKIKLKSAVVHVSLSPAHTEDGTQIKGTASAIDLSIEVPLGREVPLERTSLGKRSNPTDPEIGIVPHLGRTAEIQLNVPLGRNSTSNSLRKTIERFAKEGKEFARANGGEFTNAPDTDWTRYRFAETLIIDRPDEISLSRLFASWGFKESEIVDKPSYRSATRLTIGDTAVFFRVGDSFAAQPERAFQLSATVKPPEGEDSFEWGVAYGHSMPWLRVLPSLKGPAEFQHAIDISKGLSVGELRNRILNFAATMRSIGSPE